MKNLFLKILKHDLISGSMYIFIGSTISSFLAFILNLFFARKLSYVDYGILASLLSLFSLAVIPAQSLGTVITNFATKFIHQNEYSKASALYKKLFYYLIFFIIIVTILSLFLSAYIAKFLNVYDFSLVTILLLIVSTNYLVTLNISFLNSLLKFKFLSFTLIASGIVKLLVGILLVGVGWKVYGAIGGIFAMIIIQFFVSLFPLRKIITLKSPKTELPIREIFAFAIPVSIAIFALLSFVSSDVLLVKHFFSAKEAGLYGGLSLVGKVIFYFTLPIPAVMFPLLVKKHTNSENYSSLFYLSIVLVLIPSVLITIFYFLFPEVTIKLFLGGRDYLGISKYLGIFGIFLTIYSVNNIFVTFFLSLKKIIPALIVLALALMQIVLIVLFHNNFSEIIYVSILTSLLLLVFLVLYYLRVSGSKKLMK